MRAALYGRYSTDKQRETSVDDQLRAGRARIEREGWEVAATYADEGISGSTPLAQRPGGKALLAAALASRFDVLVLEGLDRLSREIGEQERIVKRLEHRGIRLIGTSDGYDTATKGRKVMRIARGLVNELYLDDLREKTHRGMAGQFDRGHHAGGRSYGYRSAVSADGESRHLVIDETEAEVVRWAFKSYVEGWSPIAIVHELNRRGVPSPRGGTWAISAVHGSAARGIGLLNNELYAGRVLWNRRQWLKDPDTGKRSYVERPREEWQVREAPDLRIVDAETWAAARARMDGVATRGAGVSASRKGGRPMRTLFGGVMRCPVCNGPVIAVDARRYGCGVHKDRGPAACSNSSTVPRKSADTRLLAYLREDLLTPSSLAELQAAIRTVTARISREEGQPTDAARRRLDAIEVEIRRLVDAIISVGHSDAITARLRAAEAEKAQLASQLAATAPQISPEELSAGAIARYKRMMVDLQARLESLADRERTREMLKAMLGQVTLIHDAEGVAWAEMENPAELLLAAGGIDASNRGCGGRI